MFSAKAGQGPLRGFMREDEFLQTLHFNCLRQPDGTLVNMSIPITLDVSWENYNRLKQQKAVTLVDTEGQAVAILRDPEFYAHPKEEARRTDIRFNSHGAPEY